MPMIQQNIAFRFVLHLIKLMVQILLINVLQNALLANLLKIQQECA